MTSALLSGIFQGIISVENRYFNIFLDALEDQQCFLDENSLHHRNGEVEKTISALLTKPETIKCGLQLLIKFLEQCSIEILEQKANLWLNLTIKSRNSKDFLNADEVFHVLAAFSVRVYFSPELFKLFSTNYLEKIYDLLSYVPPSGHLSALRCVESCLNLYPGSSGPMKSVIERYLSQFIDTTDEQISHYCGKCHHLLLQVRGGGIQGIQHKTQWQNYQIQLLLNLHEVLNVGFSTFSDIQEYTLPTTQGNLIPPFLELSDEPVIRAARIYVRFHNLVNYLIIALSDPFPVEKPIMPKRILEFIKRGLSITPKIMAQITTTDSVALSILLPKIHYDTIRLLETLILTLQSQLKVHYHVILNVLALSLKGTSENHLAGAKRPLLRLRDKIYDVISLWCTITKNGSCCEFIWEILVAEIFKDISPLQCEFTLKALAGSRKNMSKKARRQLQNTETQQSNLSRTLSNGPVMIKKDFSHLKKQNLCIAALNCLQKCLLSTANSLKINIIANIHIKILEISGSLYGYSMKQSQLYVNRMCRLELYKALYILFLTSKNFCPLHTQIALHLFKFGSIRDESESVRHHCETILANLEKAFHPQKEGLMFPVEYREIHNHFVKLGKEHLLKTVTIQTSNQYRNDKTEMASYSDKEGSNNTAIESAPNIRPGIGNSCPKRTLDLLSSTTVTNKRQCSDESVIIEQTSRPQDLQDINNKCNSYNTNNQYVIGEIYNYPKLSEKLNIESGDDQPIYIHDKISTEPSDKKSNNNEESLIFADIEAAFINELN